MTTSEPMAAVFAFYACASCGELHSMELGKGQVPPVEWCAGCWEKGFMREMVVYNIGYGTPVDDDA